MTKSQAPMALPHLSPWNPLDHIRLLMWFFIFPAQLRAYRKQAGSEKLQAVGAWLTATLFWLPMLTLLLAINLGTIPALEEPVPFWLVGAGIVLGWAITGLMGSREIDLSVGWRAAFGEAFKAVFVMVFGIAFGIAFGMAFLTALDLTGLALVSEFAGEFGFVVLVSTFGIAFGIAFIVADQVAFGGIFVVLPTLAFVIAFIGVFGLGFVGIFAATFIVVFGMAFVGAFVLAFIAFNLLAKKIERETDSTLERVLRASALPLLILAHAALIWLCLLGGWQTFR